METDTTNDTSTPFNLKVFINSTINTIFRQVSPWGLLAGVIFARATHHQNMFNSSDILNEIMEQLNFCETDDKMYGLHDNLVYRASEAIIRPCVATRIAKEQ
ncbi:hypothetical protein BDF14DRAFT_1253437 [Spinellus fusiger]|nr:hypothetical protein BDF14DRAFT_1253437 [Spinellus fusiger]